MAECFWARSPYLLTSYLFTDEDIVVINSFSLRLFLILTLGIALIFSVRTYLIFPSLVKQASAGFLAVSFATGVILDSLIFSFLISCAVAYFRERRARSKTIEELLKTKGVTIIKWTDVVKVDNRDSQLTICMKGQQKKKTLDVGGGFSAFSQMRSVRNLVQSKANIPWRTRKTNWKFLVLGLLCLFSLFPLGFLLSISTLAFVANLLTIFTFVMPILGLAILIYVCRKPLVETNDPSAWSSKLEEWINMKALEELEALKQISDESDENADADQSSKEPSKGS